MGSFEIQYDLILQMHLLKIKIYVNDIIVGSQALYCENFFSWYKNICAPYTSEEWRGVSQSKCLSLTPSHTSNFKIFCSNISLQRESFTTDGSLEFLGWHSRSQSRSQFFPFVRWSHRTVCISVVPASASKPPCSCPTYRENFY